VISTETASHLDTASEQLIKAALRPLFHRRTALVIPHRLSTVLTADLILVLDHGRVVERGTPAERVQRDGLCGRDSTSRAPYRKQFRAHPGGDGHRAVSVRPPPIDQSADTQSQI